jgi:hypothetical protein
MSDENKTPLPGDGDATPTAPDFLKEREWFDVDVSGLLLDFEEPYHPPRWTLSHNGTPFANRGELHIVTGKSGHGKTAFMSQVMATLLCGKFGNMQYEGEPPHMPVVLYIDTEQGKDDTIAIKNRVCSLAGIPFNEPCDRFKVARLRDTVNAVDRWRQILKLAYVIKPDVMFIDGLLDIVEDYNEQKECTPIIRELMIMATHYDMSTWCVLHENPTTEKMVGSLGSIAQRKVTEVFAVRKHKSEKEKDRKPNRPNIYFSVEQLKARGKDVEDWDFEILSVEGWGRPRELSDTPTTPLQPTEDSAELLKHIVKHLLEFMSPPNSEYFSNIVKELKKRMHIGETKAKEYFNIANSSGVFHLPINGRYTLHTSQCNAILNDLPFASSD